MSGGLWIGSYLVLSILTLWLSLAVLFLLRREHARESEGGWPSESLRPGEMLPALEEDLPAHDPDGSILSLALATANDEPPLAGTAAASLATETGLRFRAYLSAAKGGAPDWLDLCSPEVREATTLLTPRQFDRFGLTQQPVTVLLWDGLVKHAVPGALTVSQLREHFPVFHSGHRPERARSDPVEVGLAQPTR